MPDILREEGGEIVPPQPIGGQHLQPTRKAPPIMREGAAQMAHQAPAIGGNRPVGQGRRPGIEEGFQAGLGKQLSRRVSSGAIDQGQAEEVGGQREILERAFGPDWRIHVFGSKGLVQRTRQELADGSEDPNVQALYTKLMEDRKRALAAAQRKVGGKRQAVDPATLY